MERDCLSRQGGLRTGRHGFHEARFPRLDLARFQRGRACLGRPPCRAQRLDPHPSGQRIGEQKKPTSTDSSRIATAASGSPARMESHDSAPTPRWFDAPHCRSPAPSHTPRSRWASVPIPRAAPGVAAAGHEDSSHRRRPCKPRLFATILCATACCRFQGWRLSRDGALNFAISPPNAYTLEVGYSGDGPSAMGSLSVPHRVRPRPCSMAVADRSSDGRRRARSPCSP